MNYSAGRSVDPPAQGPPAHADTELHQQDELMNSELDGVKLGMTPWCAPVIHLEAKLKIDDFIRLPAVCCEGH